METGKRLKSAFPGQAWFHLTVPSSQWWCIGWNITKSNPEQRVTGSRLAGDVACSLLQQGPGAAVGLSHLNVSTPVPAQLRINGSTGEILMWEGGCQFNGLEWIHYTASKDLLNKKTLQSVWSLLLFSSFLTVWQEIRIYLVFMTCCFLSCSFVRIYDCTLILHVIIMKEDSSDN